LYCCLPLSFSPFLLIRLPPTPTLFPYTTLFRSHRAAFLARHRHVPGLLPDPASGPDADRTRGGPHLHGRLGGAGPGCRRPCRQPRWPAAAAAPASGAGLEPAGRPAAPGGAAGGGGRAGTGRGERDRAAPRPAPPGGTERRRAPPRPVGGRGLRDRGPG